MVATARAWPPGGRFAAAPVNESPLAVWLRELRDARSRGELADAQRDAGPVDVALVRKRVADALAALATLTEPALTAAVRRARQAWDQADTMVVLEPPVLVELATLRRWLAVRAAAERSESAAAALEGLLAIDASVALIRLFERRLATLLRLQLRSGEPELLPQGRPFLDLARALGEAERAWR